MEWIVFLLCYFVGSFIIASLVGRFIKSGQPVETSCDYKDGGDEIH